MIERDTELQITSEPAIAYSTCYRLPFLSLFHADCMEIMKQYPDKYFDLAIVDPPYGIGYDGAKQTSGSHGGRKAHEFKGWDSEIPSEEYFKELFRVSKNQIIWGANYFTKYLPSSMGWLVWRKDRGNFSSSDAELAFTSFNVALREYTKNPLVLAREGGTFHPTQKPICLYDWILKKHATEGMKILDTHLGSGSIAIAIEKANRLDRMNLHLTACEIDKEYIDKAIKRISESIKQGTLSF